MNFIKKIFNGETDEDIHKQFIRFGKGEYSNRAQISLWKSKKIKIKSSFEFANNLIQLACLFEEEIEISGLILSKNDISKELSTNNIKSISETKKGGLFYKNNIEKQKVSGENLLKIIPLSYFVLLDIIGNSFLLKIKKKLPKPGKNEDKIDDKFCQLEADEKYYSKIKEDFFWDLPDCKKAKVSHKFIIQEIISPENEKDFAKIREEAKRKGKIIRIAEIDGREIKSEKDFEA